MRQRIFWTRIITKKSNSKLSVIKSSDSRSQVKFRRSKKPREPVSKAIVNIQFEKEVQLFQRIEILASKSSSVRPRIQARPQSNGDAHEEIDQIPKPVTRVLLVSPVDTR